MKFNSKYEELLIELLQNCEAKVDLIDCDAQFFIEDSLKEMNVIYKKILPLNSRYKVHKNIIYKIQ